MQGCAQPNLPGTLWAWTLHRRAGERAGESVSGPTRSAVSGAPPISALPSATSCLAPQVNFNTNSSRTSAAGLAVRSYIHAASHRDKLCYSAAVRATWRAISSTGSCHPLSVQSIYVGHSRLCRQRLPRSLQSVLVLGTRRTKALFRAGPAGPRQAHQVDLSCTSGNGTFPRGGSLGSSLAGQDAPCACLRIPSSFSTVPTRGGTCDRLARRLHHETRPVDTWEGIPSKWKGLPPRSAQGLPDAHKALERRAASGR